MFRPSKGLAEAGLQALKSLLPQSAGKEFEYGNAHYLIVPQGHTTPDRATYLTSLRDENRGETYDLYGLADNHECTVA